jgi:hypothetical protein
MCARRNIWLLYMTLKNITAHQKNMIFLVHIRADHYYGSTSETRNLSLFIFVFLSTSAITLYFEAAD